MIGYLDIVPKDSCCGCSACYNICPQQCISMQPDERGFLYPSIDYQSCINCGLCKITCPLIHRSDPLHFDRSFYGCYNTSESIRLRSASGGLFSALAENTLSSGGYVAGAVFSSGYKKVLHVVSCNGLLISSMQGSKYLQSDLNQAYQSIRGYLSDGRKVLFSGTPCQVAGLKSYLGHDYSGLISVDFVCHGVPSPGVWDIYLSYLEDQFGSKAIDVTFRDKTESWRSSSFQVKFENGEVFREQNSKNAYMRGFINNLFLRPSCTKCQFKSFSSGADITLGDFWGSSELKPPYLDDKGISIVSINTAKGKELFSDIRPHLCDVREVDEKSGYVFNQSYRVSAIQNPESSLFYARLASESFPDIVDEILSRQLMARKDNNRHMQILRVLLSKLMRFVKVKR